MVERGPGMIVAVVDDDRSVLRSIEYLLESADYGVRLFTSGPELLASDCLAAIDCLISDIDMPGMDGYELLRALRVARPALPLILITGYPDRLKQLAAQVDGDPRCFTKPFQGPELLAAVRESIEKSRT
jgi:FixJ family two-component response regulator